MNTSVQTKKLKGRTLFNLVCSLAEHGISALLALAVTPLLISSLGIERYGLYPIVLESAAFFGIAFGVVNSTSGRYIAIEEERGNTDLASKYLSSAFFSNAVLGAIMVLPMLLAVLFAPRFLAVPEGALFDLRIFACLVFASVLVDALASAFGSVYYVTNRLDVRAGQQLAAALLKAGTLALLFFSFKPTLAGVGLAVLVSTAVSAGVQIFVFFKMTRGIKLSLSEFSLGMTKRMMASGLWYSVNRVASMMACGGLLVVANIFFLPKISGLYSVAFVAVNAIGGVIAVLAAVFVPTSAKHFARGENNRLKDSLVRDQKTVGLFASVAVAVFVAFCDEFFELWLGQEPSKLLVSLAVVLVVPALSLACATPIINVGMVINKTRRLALLFLCVGLLTVAAAVAVSFYTNIGIFGVAALSCASQILWYSFAVPVFASRALKCGFKSFFVPVARTYLAAALSLAFCLALDSACSVDKFGQLAVAVCASAAASTFISFFCVFNSSKIRI